MTDCIRGSSRIWIGRIVPKYPSPYENNSKEKFLFVQCLGSLWHQQPVNPSNHFSIYLVCLAENSEDEIASCAMLYSSHLWLSKLYSDGKLVTG